MSELSALGWTPYPEDVVIGDVLNSSDEFQRFYESEREKITHPVLWVRDSKLPEGIDYMCTRLQTEECVIRLRRVPPALADARGIAHELEHLVLDEEGYPIVGSMPGFEPLASAINSMVHDPIVDSRLAGFGFNIRKAHEKESAETIRLLEMLPSMALDRFAEFQWVVLYVSHLLDSEPVGIGNTKTELQMRWETKNADVAKRGQKLLARVKRIGYDTPQKQRTLFRAIA